MSLLEYAFCFRVEREHWKLSDEGEPRFVGGSLQS